MTETEEGEIAERAMMMRGIVQRIQTSLVVTTASRLLQQEAETENDRRMDGR